MKTILHIEGMTCTHCVKHIKEALESEPGVKSAEVSLDKKSATVEHEDKVHLDSLKAAVMEAGYQVN